MKMTTEAWWNLCKTMIAGILIAIAAIIGFRYLLPPLLPFIFALVIASFIRPAAIWCRRHLGLGAKPVSVILILAILSLLCFFIWALGNRLVEECTKFLVALSEGTASPDSPVYKITDMVEEFKEKLPIKENTNGGIDLYGIISGFISSGTSKLSAMLASSVGNFIKSLPSALFATGVCFIALFYLTLDYKGAAMAVKEFIPEDTYNKFVSMYKKVSHALWEYLRAYAIIMLVTFAELYLGFTIIGVEYSLLFAVVTAIVDFLPILGVGTVLIPWGAGAFLLGEYKLGLGLLVIYAVVLIVRQFIEPRIVGNFIGTHPVVALLGVYMGLKLFGVAGMIAAPILLYLAKALKSEENNA